jgi:hypothetical protein
MTRSFEEIGDQPPVSNLSRRSLLKFSSTLPRNQRKNLKGGHYPGYPVQTSRTSSKPPHQPSSSLALAPGLAQLHSAPYYLLSICIPKRATNSAVFRAEDQVLEKSTTRVTG